MVDGADGLSGGQALASLFWLAVAAIAVPALFGTAHAIDSIGPLLMIFAGATVAFLFYNMRTPWRRKAAMFLGDGGSMMLGLLVAWAVIHLSNNYGPNGLGAASALWIVAVPLTDMFSSIVRRMLAGMTPMSPDRKHLHHLLMAQGLSVARAVLAMNAMAFAGGAIGVLGWMAGVPQYALFWLLVAAFVGYLVYAHRFWQQHDESLAVREGLFKATPEQA